MKKPTSMNLNLTDSEAERIERLVANMDDALVRGTKPSDRPRVVVYRALALGLDALEQGLKP